MRTATMLAGVAALALAASAHAQSQANAPAPPASATQPPNSSVDQQAAQPADPSAANAGNAASTAGDKTGYDVKKAEKTAKPKASDTDRRSFPSFGRTPQDPGNTVPLGPPG